VCILQTPPFTWCSPKSAIAPTLAVYREYQEATLPCGTRAFIQLVTWLISFPDPLWALPQEIWERDYYVIPEIVPVISPVKASAYTKQPPSSAMYLSLVQLRSTTKWSDFLKRKRKKILVKANISKSYQIHVRLVSVLWVLSASRNINVWYYSLFYKTTNPPHVFCSHATLSQAWQYHCASTFPLSPFSSGVAP